MQNTSDQNILSLLQTDPSKGMELLMDKYIGLLWGACSICLDNTEDIRDCIQDTLLDFYEHFSRFDLENGSLKAYLYVIAKRKAMRMTLKNGKYADLDDLSEDALSEDDNWTEAILTQNILDEAIAKLHPQDGEMIRLKYYNGMTCAEIAMTMGLPYEAVKKRHQRNLKKLRYILIAILVFGLLTACAAIAVYRYRFSPSVGFQEDASEIWYEMVDGPKIFQAKNTEITIKNVVWKESKVIVEVEYSNGSLTDEECEVKIYRKDLNEAYSARTTSLLRGEDIPTKVKAEFFFAEALDSYSFEILGEVYTVDMQPIGQFEDLEDIGNAQTRDGRTVVLQQKSSDGEDFIKAYVYSENVWKITGIGDWHNSEWKRVSLTDGYAFEYIGDTKSESEEIVISELFLTSSGETPVLEFEIPEESSKVDIPFYMGEDLYRITEISVSRGTFLYTVSDENMQETEEYGDELLIRVEPAEIEKDTTLFGIQATLGAWQPDAEAENKYFKAIADNVFAEYFLDENFQPSEAVIRLQIRDIDELPKMAALRIDHMYKIWEQDYMFELE